MRARKAQRTSGFTLVELMITVTIVSILAAVALPALSTYIMQSRTTEATGFLQEVKARQESYRFDFGTYCNVSATQDNYYPSATPTSKLQQWTTTTLGDWAVLGAMPSGGYSRFVFSTVADGPGGQGPSGHNFGSDRGYPSPPTDFWFITTALGDLDDDGVQMKLESYSHTKGIWSSVGQGVE